MDAAWVALWVAWAVLFLGSFGVIEWMSRHKDEKPYLTEVIKRWVPRWLIALVIGGFCLWFYDHLTP